MSRLFLPRNIEDGHARAAGRGDRQGAEGEAGGGRRQEQVDDEAGEAAGAALEAQDGQDQQGGREEAEGQAERWADPAGAPALR
eukprot:COSAG01_NODE_1191_length_11314_cov_59.567722_14_plen_84_part_00